MNTASSHLAAALISCSLALSLPANDGAGATPKPLGREQASNEFTQINVQNLQNVSLGRIRDLGVDLINGRIVEVLVESDRSLNVGGKIVAVPPLALRPDPADTKIYRLDVSPDVFKTAPAIDLSKWVDSGRSDRVAAAYRHFSQEPYFLEEGDLASTTERRPKVSLGYVERCIKLLGMPVGNHQGERFGEVWSMTLDILKGRILNVIILAPGNLQTKSIVPAMALDFNAQRDALLLDDTKEEFADEPRYFYTAAAFGNEASSQREAYKGPRTLVALEQGSSYRDIDMTVRVFRGIRAAKLNGRNVEIGTIDDRITLRGWVYSADDKRRIGDIARAATLPELVDNQITVGRPLASK
jgi:sporulation protein YlmC with PRC-barrel domain